MEQHGLTIALTEEAINWSNCCAIRDGVGEILRWSGAYILHDVVYLCGNTARQLPPLHWDIFPPLNTDDLSSALHSHRLIITNNLLTTRLPHTYNIPTHTA